MYFRKIQTTIAVLPTLIRAKSSEKDWKKILLEADTVEKLHIIFEDMFIEEIAKETIKLFFVKYAELSQNEKSMYLDELLKKYKEFGEYGFSIIAHQTLLCFKHHPLTKNI